MAPSKKASGAGGSTQRLARFAKRELDDLVSKMEADLGFKTTAPDLVGALILAARRLPVEVVRELMPAYTRREREELARDNAS